MRPPVDAVTAPESREVAPDGAGFEPRTGAGWPLGSLKTFSPAAGAGVGVTVLLLFFLRVEPLDGGVVWPAGALITALAGIFHVGMAASATVGTCSVMSLLFAAVAMTSDFAGAGAAFAASTTGGAGFGASAILTGSGATTIGAGAAVTRGR